MQAENLQLGFEIVTGGWRQSLLSGLIGAIVGSLLTNYLLNKKQKSESENFQNNIIELNSQIELESQVLGVIANDLISKIEKDESLEDIHTFFRSKLDALIFIGSTSNKIEREIGGLLRQSNGLELAKLSSKLHADYKEKSNKISQIWKKIYGKSITKTGDISIDEIKSLFASIV